MKNILFSAFALLLFAHAAAQEPDTNFVELPAQRTYNSKTYYNPEENLYLTRVSPGYMHYRTADGAYRDIDTRLRRDSTGVFLPEGLYRARFANLTGQANRYDVTYEVARPVHEKFRSPVQRRPPSVRLQWKLLSFGYFDRLSYVYQILQNAEAVAPFVEGNRINYPQIFRGVTVRYTCGANRLKEEIVFSQAAREALPDPAQLGLAADHTYLVFAAEFTLSPNNLNAMAYRTGGRDPIRTGNGFAFEGESRIDFEDERENLYFFFPHDYAWAVNDSVSEPVRVRRIFYTQQGKNHLLIGVPWRWVRAAAPGPLLIDPTIYNDYATDTRLQSATNVGSETTLMVGKKSGQVKKRTIIKFDLQYSSIPSNATVLNAQLQLYYFNATVAGGSAWVDRWVQAHELLKSWHELQADSSER
ncbi:DNRLRE domain-containing protein, partial [bacterium]|nr:DNRLRE domain-containing protein [bacterium]